MSSLREALKKKWANFKIFHCAQHANWGTIIKILTTWLSCFLAIIKFWDKIYTPVIWLVNNILMSEIKVEISRHGMACKKRMEEWKSKPIYKSYKNFICWQKYWSKTIGLTSTVCNLHWWIFYKKAYLMPIFANGWFFAKGGGPEALENIHQWQSVDQSYQYKSSSLQSLSTDR